MNNYVDKSRGRMIILLGVLLAALWLVIAHAALEDARQEKYDGRVRPGVVESGTRTAAPTPVYVVPRPRTGVPMVSGNAVRSYAHSGHATMPSMASGSGYMVHTTSSATVHSIGSGGGSNNQSPITNHQSASSSRGISYGGASVSMPSLALVTPTYAASSEIYMTSVLAAAPGRNGHVRKAQPSDPGTDGEWSDDGADDGDWWYYDEDHWRQPYDNETRYDPIEDCTLIWTGSSWVKASEYDPGVPVGATPWLMMLMLAAGYCIAKTIRKKQNAI